MIDIQEQWAIQIDVTNRCVRTCSNCTRLIGHNKYPFFMTTSCFRKAVTSLKDFPANSPKSAVSVPNKVIGIIGGEPLLHPEFEEIVKIFCEVVPEKKYRGLWTSLDPTKTFYSNLIEKSFGYINFNNHTRECLHSPVLVAINDLIKDPIKRQTTIEDCWLQRMWSATITPKGLFFCEVAGAFDMIFEGPGGLPVEPGCWKRPISDFQEQIDRWCGHCGIPLNLKGRNDYDNIDDISTSNLALLKDSPRIANKQYCIYTKSNQETTDKPWRYLQ